MRWDTDTDEQIRPAKLYNTAGEVLIDLDDPGRPVALASAGRLVVAPGQVIASAWGNTVADQSTNQFASRADAVAQWPAPPDGARAWFADTKRMYKHYAGDWFPEAGNTTQTVFAQAINAHIVPGSGSQLSWQMTGWSAPPIVTVTPLIGFAWNWRIGAITATSVNVFVTNGAAALPDNTAVLCQVIMAGTESPGLNPAVTTISQLDEMTAEHRELTQELADAA